MATTTEETVAKQLELGLSGESNEMTVRLPEDVREAVVQRMAELMTRLVTEQEPTDDRTVAAEAPNE
jgi:hypothetical protein